MKLFSIGLLTDQSCDLNIRMGLVKRSEDRAANEARDAGEKDA